MVFRHHQHGAEGQIWRSGRVSHASPPVRFFRTVRWQHPSAYRVSPSTTTRFVMLISPTAKSRTRRSECAGPSPRSWARGRYARLSMRRHGRSGCTEGTVHRRRRHPDRPWNARRNNLSIGVGSAIDSEADTLSPGYVVLRPVRTSAGGWGDGDVARLCPERWIQDDVPGNMAGLHGRPGSAVRNPVRRSDRRAAKRRRT